MAIIPTSIPKRLRDRIEHFDDERNNDNGYIITMKYGWTLDPLQHHGVFGEDTIKDVIRILDMAMPCKCQACLQAAN